MSMLAERKRKQKWSLNPRGKEWSEDANKFGQKMLEKMGWQSGKGLGAKENGITEHIKISFKNDSKGMGYKETNDQWTEHETNFSALLESLTGEENSQESIKVSSLERKSQSSKARVHYHKFTRGKDLSRYSEKDLANIFGRKSLNKTKKEEMKKEAESDTKDGEQANEFLVNGGSMMDYFKKKLPNFGKMNGYVVGNNGVLQKEESESESESKPSFGFGFKSDNTEKNSGSETEIRPSFGFGFSNTLDKENKKSESDTKKGNNKVSFISYISDTSSKKRSTKIVEDSVFSPRKKSKKSMNVEEDNGISNPAFNPMSTPVRVQKHILNTIEESTTEIDESMSDKNVVLNLDVDDESKKKKKVRSNESIETDSTEDNYFKVKKKILHENLGKGMKKTDKSLDNPIFEGAEDVPTNISEIEENPYEVPCKKPKKKKRKAEQSIDNPTFEETTEIPNMQEIEENPYEVKTKKNKKSKKIEITNTNPNFDYNEDSSIDSSQIQENPYEVRPTEKKKKKKNKAAPELEDQVEKPIDTVNPYEVKPKKKKKKREENGIANPALDLNTKNEESIIIEDYDLMLNIVSTPIQKEELNSSPIGSVNRADSVKSRKSVRFSNVTQELIIPNNEDLKEMYGKKDKSKKKNKGLDNVNFDKQKTNLEENVDTMAKTLDNYQAEIENDINEEKIKSATVEDFMVGEVGNPDGENEQLKDGTKLKFKYANMDTRTPFYMSNTIGAKKSYKHLIKGDVLLKFKNTNLHEIKGYGVKKANAV